MFCPNENARMHQAAVPSHYGQKVIIDQCGSCGGIWFDAFELYKVKQGEAEKVEELDSDLLRASSDIDNPPLLCPRDQTELFQFEDPKFPTGIILARCPTCQGFWLNRGEFTKYQQARHELTLPKEKSPEDLKLDEEVKRLLESHRAGSGEDVLGEVGKFLSAPVDSQAFFSLDSSRGLTEEGNTLDSILNILVVLLRLFIFR